jgi:cytochrome c-type biogenesis protein CcmE
VFFFTPTQVSKGEAPKGRAFRVGGMVKEGSLKKDGENVAFVVTDFAHEVPVVYKGQLPDLFKEGKGVVAQGKLSDDSQFTASEVLAKHDENYMPPEAKHALDQAAAAKAAQSVKP